MTKYLIIAVALFWLTGCTSPPLQESATVTKAVAVLHPTDGNNVTGLVEFEHIEGDVQITLHVEHLPPGEHGFHIHQYGDCRAADATSAGGHYNPTDDPHGAPQDVDRHVGDLGNIAASLDSVVDTQWTDTVISLNGPHSIIGRAVVVHADRDDLVSQPTGNAGARLACGIIGITEEKTD